MAPGAGLACLLACAVCADTYAAGDLAIRAGRLNFDVQEFDARDDRLVHESGPLYGIEVDAGFRRRQAEIRLDAS